MICLRQRAQQLVAQYNLVFRALLCFTFISLQDHRREPRAGPGDLQAVPFGSVAHGAAFAAGWDDKLRVSREALPEGRLAN
jgi:hypothetical protein